jgi:UDP-2,3-diacylglucosamine pyrophosphatase LpxH
MIFCISDLHLGDRGYRDNFSVCDREKRFGKFLDYVSDSDGTLIILGDLLDLWQTTAARSIGSYRNLLKRLTYTGAHGYGASWLVGNHDNALGSSPESLCDIELPGCPVRRGPFETTIGGRKFAFLHGHEADPFCHDENPGLGEITAILSGMAEDRNKGPIRNGKAVEDQTTGRLEEALTIWRKLTGGKSRLDEMIDNVEKYRLDKKADVVLYGHTHSPGHIGDYHFNTGSWCRDRDTFVSIDAAGVVSMFEWMADGPKHFDEVLR